MLFRLKTHGPAGAAALAGALGISAVAARKRLARLEAAGLVAFDDRRAGVGRPQRRWRLTAAGHARFPDSHAALTLELIGSVRAIFGEAGLERLIAAREAETLATYRTALAGCATLAERAAALAALRTEEGYMAELKPVGDGVFMLVENHCPICAAARACQGFCRSELAVFRAVLGPDARVERTDHVIAGARRCAYRIAAAGRG
ncbi:MarR family transcriptional regulator [Aquibium sp. A9E412]|uniref:helix-turn-helix transcriptional regulator n=1 Tax=Aquibium sp. A9E412 TaxID=2976767 RepID=UPI0025B0487E|nr:MarR family transcriptional regulator [Aquibium sp. A9E412]MDN2565107.1 MarR family transcriptional regulator [Aquibium sp. A9E412]